MKIGIVREQFVGERRVALIPAAVQALQKKGHEILFESGAGLSAGFPDQEYREKGCAMLASRAEVYQQSELLLRIRAAGYDPQQQAELALLRPGQTLIGMMDPLGQPQAIAELAQTGVRGFALELIPRVTRAQGMDVLSSISTVAGYKAVLQGANALSKMFPLLMTAAGTLKPARVFVVGAGVAGLQAIATAKRLGAVVEAYDVRPVVREQVESLGAKFVEFALETSASETKGGYAKEQSAEFYRKQREQMTAVLQRNDVVILTAAVPGKKAPILVTGEMVAAMAPGSVIVDLAAERGGNCELTRSGETVIAGNVTILGPANLPAEVPYHASQLYAKNVSNFVLHLTKDGAEKTDLKDEIIRETLVCMDGEVQGERLRGLLQLQPVAG